MSKLTSRKFLLSAAAFLMSLGIGIPGIVSGNERLAIAGGACCVLASAIYAGCEAHVDSASAKANGTSTTVSASSTSKEIVEKVLVPQDTTSES